MLRATARSWFTLLWVRCLTALPYRFWKRALLRALAPPPWKSTGLDPATVRAFQVALRNQPGQPSCLRRAMALTQLLRANGVTARVVIGIAHRAERLEAHAWVQLNGTVIDDDADIGERFVPLDSAHDDTLTKRLARQVLAAP